MTWGDGRQPAHSKIDVSYHEKKHEIAGELEPPAPENSAWNRDMFRLIEQLTSQVTVDFSKFPLPEILQLHTQ